MGNPEVQAPNRADLLGPARALCASSIQEIVDLFVSHSSMPSRRRGGLGAGSHHYCSGTASATPLHQTKSFSTLLRELEKGVQHADLPRCGCSIAARQREELTCILMDIVDEGRFDDETVTSAWMAPGARSALLQLWSVLLRAPVQRVLSQPDSYRSFQSYSLYLITKTLGIPMTHGRMRDREAFVVHVLAPALAAQVLPAASAFVEQRTRCADAEPRGTESIYREDIEAIGLPCVNGMVALAVMEPRLQLPCNLGMAGPAVLAALAGSHALEHSAKAVCRAATPCSVKSMGSTLRSLTALMQNLNLVNCTQYDSTAAAVLNSGVLHRIGSGPCLQYYLALYTLSQLRRGPRPGGPLYGLQSDALLPIPTGGGAEGTAVGIADVQDTWLRDTLSLWTFFHSRLGVLKHGAVSLQGLFRLCLEVAEAGVEGLRRTGLNGAPEAQGRAGGRGSGGGGGASGGSEAFAAAGWWPSPFAAIHAVVCAGLLLDPAPYGVARSSEREAEACEGLVAPPPGRHGSAAATEAAGRLLPGTLSSWSSSSTAAAASPASCDGGDGGQAGGRAPGVRASAGRLRAWWRTTVGVAQACLDSEGLAPHVLTDLLALRLHGELAAPGCAALPPAPPPNLAAALSAGYVPCLERFLRQAQRTCDTPQRATAMLTLVHKGGHLPHLMLYGDVRQVAALVATAGKLLVRLVASVQPAATSRGEGVRGSVPHTGAGSGSKSLLEFLDSVTHMALAALESTEAGSPASGSGVAAGPSSRDGGGSIGSAVGRASSAGEATGGAGTTQSAAADGAAKFRALASLALVRWLPVLARIGATPSPPQPADSSTSRPTNPYPTHSLVATCVVFNLLPTLISAYEGSAARGDAAAAASWHGLLLHSMQLPRRLGPLLRQLAADPADGFAVRASAPSRAAASLELLLLTFPEMLQGVLVADEELLGSLQQAVRAVRGVALHATAPQVSAAGGGGSARRRAGAWGPWCAGFGARDAGARKQGL